MDRFFIQFNVISFLQKVKKKKNRLRCENHTPAMATTSFHIPCSSPSRNKARFGFQSPSRHQIDPSAVQLPDPPNIPSRHRYSLSDLSSLWSLPVCWIWLILYSSPLMSLNRVVMIWSRVPRPHSSFGNPPWFFPHPRTYPATLVILSMLGRVGLWILQSPWIECRVCWCVYSGGFEGVNAISFA